MGWSNQIPNPLIIGGDGVIGEIIVLDANGDELATIDEDGITVGPGDANRIVITREMPGAISKIQLFDGTTIVGELAATTGPFDIGFRLAVAGDTDARIYIRSDGAVFWGPGSAGENTNLYRAGVELLRMDGSLDVVGDIFQNSRSLPRGIMAPPVTATANGTTTVGTTETRDAVLGDYVFTSDGAARQYMVCMSGLIGNATANDEYLIRVRDGGNATPTAASTLIAETTWHTTATGTNGRSGIPFRFPFTAAAGTRTLSMFAARVVGAGTFTPLAPAGDNGTGARSIWVEDVGEA